MNIAISVPAAPLDCRGRALVPQDAAAALITVGGGYLMQHRDDKPGIFFPGHWGLFGGAFEPGEAAVPALLRELREELALTAAPEELAPACAFEISFEGHETIMRHFFALDLEPDRAAALQLGEGKAMAVLNAAALFDPVRKVTPYDAFALWLHLNDLTAA